MTFMLTRHFLFIVVWLLINCDFVASSAIDTSGIKKDDSISINDDDAKWIFWQNFDKVSLKPLFIAGFAMNICILAFDYTTFKFSYIVSKDKKKDDTIIFSYFLDTKCRKVDRNNFISFSQLNSTIQKQNYIFNNANIDISFSSDRKLPIPDNASYAANISYNSLGACNALEAPITQFAAYAENTCLAVINPRTKSKSVEYFKYDLPLMRKYIDQSCKIYIISQIFVLDKCYRTDYKYPTTDESADSFRRKMFTSTFVENESQFVANGTDAASIDLNAIAADLYATSLIESHNEDSFGRGLANAPIFDDEVWLPFSDDVGITDDTLPAFKNPIQVHIKWKKIYNLVVDSPTAAPTKQQDTTIEPSRNPNKLPTMAPTNKLVYYQLTVIQRVRNITATTLTSDDMARAVFIQSIAVLINLPYDTIHITRIDSTYTAVTTTLPQDPSGTDSADLQPAVAMFAEKTGYLRRGGEVLNKVPDLLSVVPNFAELEKSPEPESEVSAGRMDMIAGRALTGEVNECFVTYVIEFSPAQLFNITDPVVAVKWIKDKLTKRVTSGIQQFALMYFASNKDVVSMYPVTVDSAPIFSTNVPVRDSSTHSAQELSAMSMALAIGFGIFGLCLACCCSRIVCKNRSEYEVAPMLRPDAEDADHQRYIERVETENYRHYSMVQVTKPRPAPPTPEQLEQVRLQQEAERQQQEALAAQELQRAAEVRERIEKKRKIDADARIAYEEERKRIRESGGKVLSLRQQVAKEYYDEAVLKAEAEEAAEEAYRIGLMEQMFVNEKMSERDIREYRAGFAKEKRKAERLKEIRASCYNKLRKAKPLLFPDGDGGLMSREAASLLSSAVARQLSKEDNFPYQSYTGSSDGESADNTLFVEPEAPAEVAPVTPAETPVVAPVTLVIAPVTPKTKKVKREYRRLTDAENNARMEKALLKAQAYYRRKNEVEAALSLKLTESEEENEENDEKADAKEAVQLAVAEEYLDVVVAAQQAEEQEEKVNEDTAGAAVLEVQEEKADDVVVLEVAAQNEGVPSPSVEHQQQSDPRSTHSNGSNGSNGSDEHSATVLPPMHLFKLPTGSGIATAGSHTKFF